MRRYLIIATALLAAILVMSLIKAWQRRAAIARGEDVAEISGISSAHLIGALVGLGVFFLGVLVLEENAAGPDEKYRPAQITDGKITGGSFDKDAN